MQLLPLLSKVRAGWRGEENNSVWLIQIKSFFNCSLHILWPRASKTDVARHHNRLPCGRVAVQKKKKTKKNPVRVTVTAASDCQKRRWTAGEGLFAEKRKGSRVVETSGPMSPMSMATSTWFCRSFYLFFSPLFFRALFQAAEKTLTCQGGAVAHLTCLIISSRRLIVTNALWLHKISS